MNPLLTAEREVLLAASGSASTLVSRFERAWFGAAPEMPAIGRLKQAELERHRHCFPKRVILIRHAEKPDPDSALPREALRNLTERGEARAKQLPNLFLTHPRLLEGSTGVVIFTQLATSVEHSDRAFETMLPLVTRLGHAKTPLPFTLHTRHLLDDIQPIADQICSKSLQDQTVIVCWEHDRLPELARLVGLASPPGWPSDCFDDLWILTRKAGEARPGLERIPQALLFGDRPR